MPQPNVTRRSTTVWILAAITVSLFSSADAGQAVRTSGRPYGVEIADFALHSTATDSGGTWSAANPGLTNLASASESVRLLAQLSEPSKSNAKLADLDGDGKSEVIVTTLENNPVLPGPQGSGRIHVLSSSDRELPGWPVTLDGRPLNNSAAVGDIDGDGRLDVVVQTFGNFSEPLGTDPQKVWAFDSAGALTPGFPVAIGYSGDGWSTGLFTSGWTPSPGLADLDGDGVPEIVAISLGGGLGTDAGAVVAIKGDGTLLFRTTLPRSLPSGPFFDEYPHYSVPMIGNLTGGNAREVVVGVHADAASPPYSTFFALTATGAFLPGWPIRIEGTAYGNGIIETGALGDVDRDGLDEFIVASPRVESAPPKVWVFDGSAQLVSGFPKSLPGPGDIPSYPALADVDHDGFLDIVAFQNADLTNASDNNYYLVAYDRVGRTVRQTAFPAINNSLFGQGFNQLRLALAEDAQGQVCAVFPVPQYPPNQSRLQLDAMCLNSQRVSGFPITLPSLCDSSFCQDASSVSLLRDSSSTQVSGVLIDVSGNVRRSYIFNSTRPILWSQFQCDAASSGRARVSSTGPCPAMVPNDNAYVTFRGAQCTRLSTRNCTVGEFLQFAPGTSGDYPYDACAPHAYLWDFGDGHTSATKTASYAYAHNGSYPVTLTVTRSGQDPITVKATVKVGTGTSRTRSVRH